jgi:hypothetical protein
METRQEFNLSFIPDRLPGEMRRNDYGIVVYMGEARDYVAVWQKGTDHAPFFMPLSEWEKLPKL